MCAGLVDSPTPSFDDLSNEEMRDFLRWHVYTRYTQPPLAQLLQRQYGHPAARPRQPQRHSQPRPSQPKPTSLEQMQRWSKSHDAVDATAKCKCSERRCTSRSSAQRGAAGRRAHASATALDHRRSNMRSHAKHTCDDVALQVHLLLSSTSALYLFAALLPRVDVAADRCERAKCVGRSCSATPMTSSHHPRVYICNFLHLLFCLCSSSRRVAFALLFGSFALGAIVLRSSAVDRARRTTHEAKHRGAHIRAHCRARINH
jgi:hypothetical protein